MKVPVEYRAIDKKVTILTVDKRNCTRDEAGPEISEHCSESSTGSGGGLFDWAIQTGQFVCSACKMHHCDA